MNDIDSEATAAQRLVDICQRKFSCSSDEFKALIERFPNAVRIQNDDGYLPLHWACMKGHNEFIPLLIESYPQSVQMASKNGSLPLNNACEGECSLTVIQLLVEAWPDAVHFPDDDGWLPLHNASYFKCACEVIQILLHCWPESVRCRTIDGDLPLHFAGREGQSLNAIQVLLEAWPDSICEKDSQGFLPLHHACAGNCKDDVIQFLIEFWPPSVQMASQYGMLPLHSACKGGTSLTILQSLVQVWPNSVRMQDCRGMLPLHFAFEYRNTLDVIQFLVHSWPKSCRIPTKWGGLALHCACENQSLDVILFILDCYPQAICCKKKDSRLPLHTACLRLPFETDWLTEDASKLQVIEHLIRAWPVSIKIPCRYMYKYEIDEDDGDDQDSDTEHLDYDLDGEEVEDNCSGCGGNGNDELTIYVSNLHKLTHGFGLPIDLACAFERNPPPHVIRLLTNQMPPLHFVCTHAAKFWGPQTMITMDYLLSVFPEDARLFHHGMLPFHCACRAGATRSSVKWWLKKCPTVVPVVTEDTGDTLLHCYLSSVHAPLNGTYSRRFLLTVQLLVEKHPDALRTTNRMRMLPFHVAAVHQAPLDVLFYLACRNPEALLYRSGNLSLSDNDQLVSEGQAVKKRKISNL